ncbi:MAG TPA: aminoacetone oxidase family FAD-binding enzyme [Bacilli bacterium]|nr:aminoacetone oxidase family FAD-binding enzyme [Bacilli bacterium]
MKKVVIIGGGVAGLTTGIIASKNCEVIILEKNNNLGKKILVTGNGKCNYFNDDFTSNHFYSENKELLNQIINNENVNKVKSFFNEIGIIPRIKDNYYYPYSNQAVSIQNTLISELNNNVKIYTNTIVEDVIKENNKYIIKTNNELYEADVVVLTTGSKAFYDDNNSDIGLSVAKSFNHEIIKMLPSLTPLKLVGNFFKEWNGIRCDSKISLYSNNKLIKEEVGELQLTNYGISGICTFQLSNQAIRLLDNKEDVEVSINFLDFLNINNYNEFNNYFNNRNNKLNNKTISELFDTILNYKLSNLLLKISKIDYNKKYNKLNNKEKEILCNNMINLKLKVILDNNNKEAQVCSGGIKIDSINLNTMESNNSKDLYFGGEILDITGDCGGYNLGFAFISGILIGNSIRGE